VPYPLQNHLCYFFGTTLTDMFLGPFHELHTAGLRTRIAPQDGYKTLVDAALAIRGTSDHTPAVGYNATIFIPSA
jgi:hypothetical protein